MARKESDIQRAWKRWEKAHRKAEELGEEEWACPSCGQSVSIKGLEHCESCEKFICEDCKEYGGEDADLCKECYAELLKEARNAKKRI
jgi:hypothetical protein